MQSVALVDITDGTSLDAAIRSGKVWSEAGPVFSGKEIETLTEEIPTFRMRLYGMARFYAPEEVAENVYHLTGRCCWSFAGKGYAYELKPARGRTIWASGIQPTDAAE